MSAIESAIEASLSYRGARRLLLWLAATGRASLVGRFVFALARVLRRVGGDSVTFGTAHVGSRVLGRSDHPLSVLALSRPYLWLRKHLPGPAALAPASVFTQGAWMLLLGAGCLGLGIGRLLLFGIRGVATVDELGAPLVAPLLRLAAPILLLIVGAVILGAGRRLSSALPSSALVRGGRDIGLAVVEGADPNARAWRRADTAGGGSAAAWGRLHPGAWAGVVLALVAGLSTGLVAGSDTLLLMALVAAIALVLLVFWRPEVLLLGVAAFPWVDWVARAALGGFGPAWDDALLVMAVVLLLWAVLVLRRWSLWTVPILLPALLAFVAALGSVVVREVPSDVGVFALRVLFQPLLFFFIGFLFPKDRRWVQWAIGVFLLASVALALHGLYQYVTHAPMPASWVDVRETDIATRAYSIIENPNGLGAFLLLGTLISLSLTLGRGVRPLQRWVMAAVCVVQLGGIAVTFSRGAWVGLGIGLVALLILAYRRYLVPLVAAGVIVWFAAPAQFTNRLTFAFSSAYITKSMAAGRLLVWKMSLQHIVAHPLFGVGLGTFGGTAAVRFGYGRLWVDNFYLQLAAEGGLILLALFLWLLLRAAKGLVRAHSQAPDPYMRALTAGTFGAFMAVAGANLTASVWETLVVGVGFWFLTGLVTSAVLHAEPVAAREGAVPPAAEPGARS